MFIKTSPTKFISIIFLNCVLIAFSGCASGATVEGMTLLNMPKSVTYNKKLQNTVTIDKVTGGSETNPLWRSEISDLDFKEALRQSFLNLGYLSTKPENDRYVLVVNLKNVDQPYFGLDFKVTTSINYILMEKSSKKIIFNHDIVESSTATFTDATFGVKRLRLANESSIKKNIGQLIYLIQELDPDKIRTQLK